MTDYIALSLAKQMQNFCKSKECEGCIFYANERACIAGCPATWKLDAKEKEVRSKHCAECEYFIEDKKGRRGASKGFCKLKGISDFRDGSHAACRTYFKLKEAESEEV